MINCKDIPIFVTGAERSGRTIVAKILKLSGAFTGDTNSMLENEQIKSMLNCHYQLIGADWNGQYPLPQKEQMFPLNDLKSEIESILQSDGYNGQETWLYKSSKLCQLWSVWAAQFPNAKWIIVRRKPSDIAYSCCKTMYMTAFSSVKNQKEIGVNSEREGWLWWVKQHERMFQEMVAAGLNIKVVWPEDLVNGNYSVVKEILDWVDLPFDEDQIRKEIDPMLWKSRINRKEK
jgi:hypothetical protein